VTSKIPFDAIRKKNLANIMAKVKAGKPLTSSESRTINDAESRSVGHREQRSDEEKAAEYGITRQTVVRWRKSGAPFHNDKEFWMWMRKNGIRSAMKWRREFEANNPDECKPAAKPVKIEFKTAEQLRDEYLSELQLAKIDSDENREKVALNAYLKIEKQIRESEAHSAKLGLDNGTVLPRAEVERIMRSVFYAGNACIQGVLTSICEQLVGYDDPGDLYHALKPAVTGGRLFSGFDKVSNVTGAPNIPSWVVDCVKLEAEQYLGNSESLWTRKLK